MSKHREPLIDMEWRQFASILLETEDLDPVYVMLAHANLEEKLEKRFLLAYWCFYNCGVAARIAESKNFYRQMTDFILDNPKVPRGMERRYFYGQQARDTVQCLIDHGSPERIVTHMCSHRKFQQVFDAVLSYVGFGPWMGWKIADMAERVLLYPIDFRDCELGIYKDPVAGAAFIRFGSRYDPITPAELKETCVQMEYELDGYMAPPWYDRPVNVQEIETVLCKYKAHCYGAYPLGNDTEHLRKALEGQGDLAQELLKHVPVWEWKWGISADSVYRDAERRLGR